MAMCQSEDCVCVRGNQDGTMTKLEEEDLTEQHGALGLNVSDQLYLRFQTWDILHPYL